MKSKKLKQVKRAEVNKKLWEVTSELVRYQAAVMQKSRFVSCYTCGKTHPAIGKGCINAGHFIPGRLATGMNMWDLRGLRPQCVHCNLGLGGNPVVYEEKLLEEFGSETVAELKQQAKKAEKVPIGELLTMLSNRLLLVRALKSEYQDI